MFRCTGAIPLADYGVSIVNLKRMGRWKSDACIEGYLENSHSLKKMQMDGLANSINRRSRAEGITVGEFTHAPTETATVNLYISTRPPPEK